MQVRNKIKPEIAYGRGTVRLCEGKRYNKCNLQLNELWEVQKKRYICALLTTTRHLTEHNMMR